PPTTQTHTLSLHDALPILRPTFLNKGIDFQVWVEKFDGEKDKRPSHGTIIEDVKEKLKESPTQKKALMAAIERVWNCEDPDKVLDRKSTRLNSSHEWISYA